MIYFILRSTKYSYCLRVMLIYASFVSIFLSFLHHFSQRIRKSLVPNKDNLKLLNIYFKSEFYFLRDLSCWKNLVYDECSVNIKFSQEAEGHNFCIKCAGSSKNSCECVCVYIYRIKKTAKKVTFL